MACIEKIYSVSALIGCRACNAKCAFCAGEYLRPQAPRLREQDLLWERNYVAAIKLSAKYGGWSLSLTSSGEPTMDPEAIQRALFLYHEAAFSGAYFPNVNLFTNGIRFADREFCKYWLPRWRSLGLTNVAVSLHSENEEGQSRAYGVPYPRMDEIFDNIREQGVGVRATLLLRKGGIEDWRGYENALYIIKEHFGVDNVTSWPVSNPDGSRSSFTPSRLNLMGIRWWLHRHAKLCHGHVWGGGVYDYNGMMVRMTDYVTRHDPKKDYVRQLVVFQDGAVAYSWIREGALCMK